MTAPRFKLYEAIGLRIRTERERLDVSTKTLAERLAELTGDDTWGRSKVSRYETGARHISIAELIMVAKALGVSVDHLLVPVIEPTVSVAGVPVDMRTVLSPATNAVDQASREVSKALVSLSEAYEDQKRRLINIQRSMKGGTQ